MSFRRAATLFLSAVSAGLACTPQLATGPQCSAGQVLVATDGGWTCATLSSDAGTDLSGVQAQLNGLDGSVQALEGELGGLDGSVGTLGNEVTGIDGTLQALQGQVNGLDGSVQVLKSQVDGLDASVLLLEAEVGGLPAASSSDATGTVALRDGNGSFAARTLSLDGNLQLADGGILLGGAQVMQGDPPNGNFFVGVGAQNNLQGQNGAQNDVAVGTAALASMQTGGNNTAVGAAALAHNSAGNGNTAVGSGSLENGTGGSSNSAFGSYSLQQTVGSSNTAVGNFAMSSVGASSFDTAVGANALQQGGSNNTAVGYNALQAGGDNSTAVGYGALATSTGEFNIGIGYNAGSSIQAGNYNIDIGNAGVPTDFGAVRIGTTFDAGVGVLQTYIAGIYGSTSTGGIEVYINTAGQLGTVNSSARYKQDIRDIGADSAVLMALRPVAFKYKPEYDAAGLQQYGLIAEEVEQVAPQLVVYGDDGKVQTVRYNLVNALLLNEVQKLRIENDAQAAELAKERLARQRYEASVEARLKALEQPRGH